MVETVRPVQLPPELKITIRGACDALAPQDALDSRLRRGIEATKDEAPTLAKRRRAARAAAVRLATMLDEKAASEFFGPAEKWLASPPSITKDKDGNEVNPVQDHLLTVGLLESYVAGVDKNGVHTRGARPSLGSPGRKACYQALLSFKEEIPSACAQRVFEVAMALVRAVEVGMHKESGSAHSYVAGLIGQGG